VYAFCGLALGYLDGDSVYSFRGRHLGWWEDGWIFDHHGARALFTEAAVVDHSLMEALAGLELQRLQVAHAGGDQCLDPQRYCSAEGGGTGRRAPVADGTRSSSA
jgi:hypothetical protein